MENIGHIIVPASPRCGSSSFYKYLLEHPQMRTSANENHLLINENINSKIYEKSLYENRAKWNISPKLDYFTMDVSVGYCYKNPLITFNNAYRLKPNAKIILLFRNPTDRIYSNYNFFMRNTKKQKNFEDDWKDFVDEDDQKMMTDYNTILNLWELKFDVKVIISEDLFIKTKETMIDVFKFLGIFEYEITDISRLIPEGKSNQRKALYKDDCRNKIYNYYKDMINELSKKLKRNLWQEG